MSRKIIQTHEPVKDNPLKETEAGKIIITTYKDHELALLYQGGRLLQVEGVDQVSRIDTIFIGKVKNVVKNLNACFVEIANKELCYLPLEDAKVPLLLNRVYDGRILQGDELLVQLNREALKTKAASVTCHISMQGEHFVFALGDEKVGVSNKLTKKTKDEIKTYLLEQQKIDEQGCLNGSANLPPYGCVVRTQAEKLFAESHERFLQELLAAEAEFVNLLETAKHRTCFSCIKAPEKPFETILDKMCRNVRVEVVTDLPEAYTSLQGHVECLRYYDTEDFPLNKLYAVESKLLEALSKTVWLNSGAYLVIEQTECLSTIDVNSGKMIKGKEKDESIWKINVEAAKEAALQIRLRNLSGIIIIDFINMADKSREEELISLMREEVGKDIALTKVVDMTPLGLMEITRKKTNASLQEQLGNVVRKV